jgi:hypothetical protein
MQSSTLIESPAGGVVQHPYFQSYTQFQQPYDYFAQLGDNKMYNNSTTQVTTQNITLVNDKYRFAAGYAAGDRYNTFFSPQSVKFMSYMISQKLKGVHPEGKNIIVPDATILSVADSVWQSTPKDAQTLQEMTINYIVNDIKTEYDTISRNNQYSIWVQKYDQSTGMKQFPDAKLNLKQRSAYFQMRY